MANFKRKFRSIKLESENVAVMIKLVFSDNLKFCLNWLHEFPGNLNGFQWK